MDFIKDNNPKILNYIKSLGNVPAYVDFSLTKSASTMIYADTIAGEFPIDTKSNTWLSYAYIKSAAVVPFNYNKIVDNIELAAASHGIYEDIKSFDSSIKSLQKSASNRKYAFYLDDNSVKGYYPINSVSEIEKSASALVSDYNKLPIEGFHSACVELVKAAESLGMDINYFHKQILDHGIEKEANYDIAEIVAEQRANLVKDPEAKELYAGLVKFAKEEPQNTEQFISLFADLDRAYGVEYKHGTVDPYKAFYSGYKTQDIEKCASSNVVLSGIIIPYADIKNTRPDVFDMYLPKDDAVLAKEAFTKSSSSMQLTNAFSKLPEKLQSDILGVLLRT